MTRYLLISVSALASLSACSTQAWYDGFKYSQKQECERLQGSAREECLEQLNTQSYEDYKASKDDLDKPK